ncbi:MAG: alpha/beta hydrolase [Dysgonamonadaceae bacterium]|jgi:pimeloyl-ACP methyl ester carboxylesterase|nr:alpha/beta hydrolase [Dysgonamonadaceae bacterium]
MAFVKIKDTNIYYLESNKEADETILMLHGMFSNMAVFYLNIAPKLAEKYHIVLYDFKGHGMSDVAASGYDLRSMTEEMLELIEKLHLKKVHITGYSFGGLIALYTLIHYPDIIGKAAIIEAPNPDTEEHRTVQTYSRDLLLQKTMDSSSSTQLKPSNRKLNKLNAQIEFLLNKSTLQDDMRLFLNFFEEIPGSHISNETLLLYGNQSDCVDSGYFLHQSIKDSQLFIGEGDHNIPVQNSQWITDKLVDFFF